MRSQRWDYVFLVAIAGLIFFSNLGGPKLWDRDEPRNAGCAREMLDRGDWVVPVFNAEMRTHKPVLLYWLMMTAYTIFGVSEFSARFWSATLGAGTILLTYQVGSHLLGRQVGRLAGCSLATFLLFVVVARAATPDSALIFCSTLAIWLFVRSSFVPAQLPSANDGTAGRRSCDSWRWPFPDAWGTAVGIYAAMGLAVLAKGPVGLVLPTAVIGMYCLLARLPDREFVDRSNGIAWWIRATMWTRPFWPAHFLRTCWAMRPLTAVATACCVAGPWYVWVGWRTGGAWLAGFLGEHNMGRAMSAMEGHQGSFLFYPAALILSCLPWTVFTIPAIIDVTGRIRADHARRQPYVLLVCWLTVYVALFSLAQTKLPSYVAPAFPAVAILISAYAVAATRKEALAAAVWWRLGFAALGLIGVLTCGGLAWATARYLPELKYAWALGGVLLAAGMAGLWLVSRAADALALRVLVVGSVCFAVLTFGMLSVRVGNHQRCQQLLAAAAGEDAQPAALAAFGRLEPSWVFYAGRPIRYFRDDRAAELVRYLRSDTRPMLLTTRRRWHRLPNELADQLVTVSRVPYFLKDDELLLCSLPAPPTVAGEWLEIHDFLAEGHPAPAALVAKLQNGGAASQERLWALRDVLVNDLDRADDPLLHDKLAVKIARLKVLIGEVGSPRVDRDSGRFWSRDPGSTGSTAREGETLPDASFVHKMSGLASLDQTLRELSKVTQGDASRDRCRPSR